MYLDENRLVGYPPLTGWIRTRGNGEWLGKDESRVMIFSPKKWSQDVNVIPDVRFKHDWTYVNFQLAHHLVGAINHSIVNSEDPVVFPTINSLGVKVSSSFFFSRHKDHIVAIGTVTFNAQSVTNYSCTLCTFQNQSQGCGRICLHVTLWNLNPYWVVCWDICQRRWVFHVCGFKGQLGSQVVVGKFFCLSQTCPSIDTAIFAVSSISMIQGGLVYFLNFQKESKRVNITKCHVS